MLSLLQYTTLPLAFALQLLTAVLILRRKQVHTFPVFFAYTVFHLAQAIVSFVAFRISYKVYFYEWWAGELLDVFLSLAVLQEIFRVTFQPYDALRRWSAWIYFLVAVLLCGSALVMGYRHPAGYSPRVAALLTLDRSANFVFVGLLLFLFLFYRLFGMTWRHYVFGIASGFVLMASMVTASEALRTYFGQQFDSWATAANALAFTFAVALWTYYFGSKRSRVALDQVPGTEKLITWNRALGEIGRR
ncbi:MAG TPA: hypothetical protein VFU86_22595 [Terriglobales bacterium]|nr:hypothetical protein [Terriglobales bacterium]